MLKSKSPSIEHEDETEENKLDFDITNSVALKRLISEIHDENKPATGHSAAYNRTYHRHNR